MISSRKLENVEKTVADLQKEGLNVKGIPCHVAKEEDRQKLIGETMAAFGGRIDALVSNAAANPAYGPLQKLTSDQWDKIFDTNVKATWQLTNAVLPVMQKQKSGSLVFISSVAGYTAFPGLGAYSISKTALFGLSKVVASEQASFGVRCNVIAPGIIKTYFSEALWKEPKTADKILKNVPLQKFGEAEDIAGTAAFLCSDDSAYMTGESLAVTGGMVANRL